MEDATIIDFTGRDAVTDPLTDLLRKGARELLQAAVEAERDAADRKAVDVEDAPDADEDSAADFALPSAGASFSFASASRRSSMVAHSLMAVEADRRSRDPSATNSRAAREEKPAHEMARNARYRRSCAIIHNANKKRPGFSFIANQVAFNTIFTLIILIQCRIK